MNPLLVAIVVSQVDAPGLPVTIIVWLPLAVPKLVKKSFKAVADNWQFNNDTPLESPDNTIFCIEVQDVNIVVVVVNAIPLIDTETKDWQTLNILVELVKVEVTNKGIDCKTLQAKNILDIFVTLDVLNKGTDSIE